MTEHSHRDGTTDDTPLLTILRSKTRQQWRMMSDRIGISEDQLSAYATGKRTPVRWVAEAIATDLRLTVDELFPRLKRVGGSVSWTPPQRDSPAAPKPRGRRNFAFTARARPGDSR